jgi:hypothetical protein
VIHWVAAPPNRGGNCSVSGCYLPHCARGFCQVHYDLCRRNGAPIRVRTENGAALRFLEETVLTWTSDECLFWPYARTEAGYARLSGGKRLVCPLVCERIHGPPQTPGLQSAHSCGKGHLGCCNPLHLSWKSPPDNNRDKIVHGTMAWGEGHGQAKLKLEDIPKIRALKGIMFQREIAEMFGVSRGAIKNILTGKTWAGACPPFKTEAV